MNIEIIRNTLYKVGPWPVADWPLGGGPCRGGLVVWGVAGTGRSCTRLLSRRLICFLAGSRDGRRLHGTGSPSRRLQRALIRSAGVARAP